MRIKLNGQNVPVEQLVITTWIEHMYCQSCIDEELRDLFSIGIGE
jgi:hypothetical protein